MKTLSLSLLVAPLLCISVTGCSSSNPVQAPQPVVESGAWLADGYIALSRPAPEVNMMASAEVLSSMYAFFPIPAMHAGPWLSVDTKERAIRVMDGDKVESSVNGDGIEGLTPGTYQVVHKQRGALWHAPDSYYVSRKLPAPPQGDKLRFLRGALGEFVLFIGNDSPVPLHCGPVWLSEIGGVRMEEDQLSRLYYNLPVGAVVEVK